MRALTISVALCIAHPAASATSASDCPKLPSATHLQWHFAQREEWAVCYATPRDSNVQVFAFYFLRYTPVLPPGDRPVLVGPGEVAGREVTWYDRGSNKNVGTLSRQSNIGVVDKSGNFVWYGLTLTITNNSTNGWKF